MHCSTPAATRGGRIVGPGWAEDEPPAIDRSGSLDTPFVVAPARPVRTV